MGQAIRQVTTGDRVKINFRGTLEDGTLFDTTYADEACEDDDCSEEGCGCETGPMELEVGAEEFFPLVEQALLGMTAGERKTLTVPAEEAFGEYDAELVFTVPRGEFPGDIEPAVGDDLELVNDDGEGMVVTVVDLDEREVTLDANHPLAGEALTFEVELLEIL